MEQFKILTDLRDYIKKLEVERGRVLARPIPEGGSPCSGSMIPDTQIGGNLTIKEVFNDKKTTSIIHSGVQA